MATAEKKPRLTAHRLAASNPEVRERIKLLGKRWGRAKGEERRERVLDLLGRGCSIRGVAQDIHQSESVVRYYSEPEPSPLEKKKQAAVQSPVPVNGGRTGTSTQVAAGEPARGLLKDQSDSANRIPESSRKKAPNVPLRRIQLPPRPVLKPPEEKEEPIGSLRMRLSEIIVGFTRAQWGIPKSPIRNSELPNFLSNLQMHVGIARQWMQPKEIPERISIKTLLQMTEPKRRNDDPDWSHNAWWIATTLVSLVPDIRESLSLQQAVERAHSELLPQPQVEPEDDTVDEWGRPRKPYEIRWRRRARSLGLI
jgi:hypothetical protein